MVLFMFATEKKKLNAKYLKAYLTVTSLYVLMNLNNSSL